MISIEAWRGQIGSFNRVKSDSKSIDGMKKTYALEKYPLCMIQTIITAAMITILLIIGGIEINPGPATGATQIGK